MDTTKRRVISIGLTDDLVSRVREAQPLSLNRFIRVLVEHALATDPLIPSRLLDGHRLTLIPAQARPTPKPPTRDPQPWLADTVAKDPVLIPWHWCGVPDFGPAPEGAPLPLRSGRVAHIWGVCLTDLMAWLGWDFDELAERFPDVTGVALLTEAGFYILPASYFLGLLKAEPTFTPDEVADLSTWAIENARRALTD